MDYTSTDVSTLTRPSLHTTRLRTNNYDKHDYDTAINDVTFTAKNTMLVRVLRELQHLSKQTNAVETNNKAKLY